MTSDQWVALVGQIGIGGVALVGMAYLFVKVVVPMASARASEIVAALRDLTAEIRQLRADNTAEHQAIIAGLSDICARISRLEGIYDHHGSNPGLAVGSRDQGNPGRQR